MNDDQNLIRNGALNEAMTEARMTEGTYDTKRMPEELVSNCPVVRYGIRFPSKANGRSCAYV